MKFIFRPDADVDPGGAIGAKAGALLRLRERGFLIPNWFVVLPQACAASLSASEPRVLSEADAEIEERLARLMLGPPVVAELRAALAALCPRGERVAVRSSAREEDGSSHSFAGQLETFLRVHPEDVAAQVVAVWRSAFATGARGYRAQHQLSGQPAIPAVLVQRMLEPAVAGVAFGADPVSGRRDIAVVCAGRGLGDGIARGDRNADTWQVDAAGGVERRLAGSEARGCAEMEGAPAGAEQPALDDVEVRAVARMVRDLGDVFGCPQDAEWAMEDGRLYVLQSRPITPSRRATPSASSGRAPSANSGHAPRVPWGRAPSTGSGQTALERGAVTIWDNSNIAESYSGVTTPLTFSFARRAYAGVYRQFCRVLAVSRARIADHDEVFSNLLGLVRGRVYYNLLNWYRILALLPGFTINRRFMEQMMGVKEQLPEELVTELGRATATERLKDAFALARSMAALVRHHLFLPRTIRRFHRTLDEVLTPPPRPLEAMTAPELRECFLGLERRLLLRWDAPLINDFLAMIFYGVLRRLIPAWVDASAGPLQNDLLCGSGGMLSAEPAGRIRELAACASADPEFAALLRVGAFPAIQQAMARVPRFAELYEEYLAKFGERCVEELKLESRTLQDDPLPLLRAIGRLAGATAGGALRSNPSPRQDAEMRARAALRGHPVRGWVFGWVLRHARARVRDRENLRLERTRVFGRVRRIFIELGRRLHGAGRLKDARDIFHLEVDEVLAMVAGAEMSGGISGRERVEARRAEFDGYRAGAPPPGRFTTLSGPGSGPEHAPVEPGRAESAGDLRQGLGCCPGVVRGVIRRVIDPRDATVRPGEILVAERTDPGWILIFPAAAGLLVEHGSLLSHSAIVARELGLPTVVSVGGLMEWLRDGDLVEFDGASGWVRRAGRAGAIARAVDGEGEGPVTLEHGRTSIDRLGRVVERPVGREHQL